MTHLSVALAGLEAACDEPGAGTIVGRHLPMWENSGCSRIACWMAEVGMKLGRGHVEPNGNVFLKPGAGRPWRDPIRGQKCRRTVG